MNRARLVLAATVGMLMAGCPRTRPIISSFTASPDTIAPGASSTLSWDVTGADTVIIDNGVGTAAGPSVSVTPSVSTTYTLTAANAAGSVTARALVTVTGSFVVTVRRQSVGGGLEGVPGIAVHRGDTATGALRDSRVTDAGGAIDFSDAGVTRATLSLVLPSTGQTDPSRILTLLDVPAGPVNARHDRLRGAADRLASVDVVPREPLSEGELAACLTAGCLAPAGVPITRADLQADGRVSVVAQVEGWVDDELAPVACGSLPDEPVPAQGATLTIDTSLVPGRFRLADSGSLYVIAVAPVRKGIAPPFPWAMGRTCATVLAGADGYLVRAETRERYEESDAGDHFKRELRTKQVVGGWLPGPSLPATATLAALDVQVESLEYQPGRITFAVTGSQRTLVDAVVAEVSWTTEEGDSYRWQIAADPATGTIVLPSIPGVKPPPTPLQYLEVSVEAVSIDGRGFDAFFRKLADAGDLDAVRAGGFRSAIAHARLFRPLYALYVDQDWPWYVDQSWGYYGRVTSDDGQMDCGNSRYGRVCEVQYVPGTEVTLTANPNTGALFQGWKGDCAGQSQATVHLVMDREEIRCAPIFVSDPRWRSHELIVAVRGGEAVDVSDLRASSEDGTIWCDPAPDDTHCSHLYGSGAAVRLSWTSGDPAHMQGHIEWSGDCSGTGTSTEVIMDKDRDEYCTLWLVLTQSP